jgi:dTDP-4-amino-4,6-dideoxygalactose transaminase
MEQLAVSGGKPFIMDKFPEWPIWDETDVKSVADVVRSSEWEWHNGTQVTEFEKRFAKSHHADFALSCANGTVAIELLLEALDIGKGDEVIVPDYTYTATAIAPVRRGATVVLVDIDPDTFCIDPLLIEQAITDKTKAIIPVHFGGHPCDMNSIVALAEKHGLYIITDCAHAHGAQWDEKHVGTLGHAGTFSFQASKTISCGEGGAILSNDENLMRICRSLHNFGRVIGQSMYQHASAGTNYRMSELQAGLLLSQLDRFEQQSLKREKNGKLLASLLSQVDGIRPQGRAPSVTRHGYYLFTFILDADVPRDAFRTALAAEGVPVQSEYTALHTHEYIRKAGMDKGDFPVSDRLASRSIWLFHNCLLAEKEQVALIAGAVKKVLHGLRKQ